MRRAGLLLRHALPAAVRCSEIPEISSASGPLHRFDVERQVGTHHHLPGLIASYGEHVLTIGRTRKVVGRPP